MTTRYAKTLVETVRRIGPKRKQALLQRFGPWRVCAGPRWRSSSPCPGCPKRPRSGCIRASISERVPALGQGFVMLAKPQFHLNRQLREARRAMIWSERPFLGRHFEPASRNGDADPSATPPPHLDLTGYTLGHKSDGRPRFTIPAPSSRTCPISCPGQAPPSLFGLESGCSRHLPMARQRS